MVWAKRSSSWRITPVTRPMRFQQFGISLAHLFGHLLRHLEKEWPLQAQHPSVPHGAANDLAQHVAAAFVRGHHAVADQERRGAAVVGENAQAKRRSPAPCHTPCRKACWQTRSAAEKGPCRRLLIFPCRTAARRSRPAPVSIDGLGSGATFPAASRLNCMNTRFQIST